MVAPATPRRFQVWRVELDPTRGSEIAKTRPCVVVSPDAANRFLRTVLVVPLTHTRKRYPTRVNCTFRAEAGQVALDQIRAVDTGRLVKQLGELDEATGREVCAVLGEMFAWQFKSLLLNSLCVVRSEYTAAHVRHCERSRRHYSECRYTQSCL